MTRWICFVDPPHTGRAPTTSLRYGTSLISAHAKAMPQHAVSVKVLKYFNDLAKAVNLSSKELRSVEDRVNGATVRGASRSKIDASVKYPKNFRPCAPVVLDGHARAEVSVVLNTSFCSSDETIVCPSDDAIRTFVTRSLNAPMLRPCLARK